MARVRDLVYEVLDLAELNCLRIAAEKINQRIEYREQRTRSRKDAVP